MRYTFKGTFGWETSAGVGDKIKKITKNLLKRIKGETDEKVRPDDQFISFENTINGDYEIALDINCEEMIQLLKCQIESDKTAIDMLKDLGAAALRGAKEARKVAAEEIPEWRKILHQDELQTIKDDAELRKVRKAADKTE